MKLNLGCGGKKLEGYVNVDKFGDPDIKKDLELVPWPWQTNSISEVKLVHVLEHLGKDTDTYFSILKEIYRICTHGALIHIIVPHFRHDSFYADPTHVRVITPWGLRLFSKKLNRAWIEEGGSTSPLGLQLNIDFELKEIIMKPSDQWFKLHPEENVDVQLLLAESKLYNNLIEEYEMKLEVIKN